MKKLIILTLLLTGFSQLQAQDLSKPKSGNAIRLKDYTVTLSPGQETDLSMWIVKSKKYELRLGQPAAKGQEGINFWFSQDDESPYKYGMKIKVDEQTATGKYMYVLQVPGTGRNAVKSTTLMVEVVANKPL